MLLVDDEPAMRLLCRVDLPHSGLDVTEAADGETALARAGSERFDLALLDVMMPGMGGFELAERLRADAHTSDLPIVCLSARAARASGMTDGRLHPARAGCSRRCSGP